MVDGVFDADAAGGAQFHEARALCPEAIAEIQARVRSRLLRALSHRNLLEREDAQAMGEWGHGGGFSLDASVRKEGGDSQRFGTPAVLLRSAITALAAPPAETPVVAAPVPAASPKEAEEPLHCGVANYAWALLLARIYEAFPLLCPKCGGEMRIIAFITEAVAVRDILAHRGEATSPPHMAPAGGLRCGRCCGRCPTPGGTSSTHGPDRRRTTTSISASLGRRQSKRRKQDGPT